MNIYTVRDNLKTTIANKEQYLAETQGKSNTTQFVRETISHFLEINLQELRAILADVEVCCKQASEASWRNDDRQGGI